MTIKVEREALLRVLERPPLNTPIPPPGEFVVVDCFKPIHPADSLVEKLRLSTSCDDDDSVFTVSTASFSDTDSEDGSIQRRVSFAEELVTNEWTRPFTPKEDLSHLFYTTEETQKYVQPSTVSTCRLF